MTKTDAPTVRREASGSPIRRLRFSSIDTAELPRGGAALQAVGLAAAIEMLALLLLAPSGGDGPSSKYARVVGVLRSQWIRQIGRFLDHW